MGSHVEISRRSQEVQFCKHTTAVFTWNWWSLSFFSFWQQLKSLKIPLQTPTMPLAPLANPWQRVEVKEAFEASLCSHFVDICLFIGVSQ